MRMYQAAGIFILLTSLSVAMGGAGIPKKEDVPKYIFLLKSKSGADRAKAAEMLGKRGSVRSDDVEKAIEPLRLAVQKDPDAGARKAAAIALGSIHPEAKDTVPVLIAAAKDDKSMDVKIAAAESLGAFGPEASEGASAVRAIIGKLDAKKDRQTRKVLQEALSKITGAKKKK